jgi:dihydrofolate reductase
MISIVIAMTRNNVIGKDNLIPWRVRDDLVRLKKLVKGHTVILGRKTFDSLSWYYDKSGRRMPGENYIVITRDRSYVPSREYAKVAHSVQDAVRMADDLGDLDVFVIGGVGVFAEMLPLARRVYLTEIQADVDGDSRFTALDRAKWHEVSREHHHKDDRNEYDFDFVVLEKA